MPNARRTRNTRSANAHGDERGDGQPAVTGSGGATSPLGAAPSGSAPTGSGGTEPDAERNSETARIARSLSESEKRRKRQDYNREWKRRKAAGLPTTGPGGIVDSYITREPAEPIPESTTETFPPSAADPSPSFQTINAGESARRSYNRKPKRDPEQIAIIGQTVKLLYEAIGSAAAGETVELNQQEAELTIGPITRMVERMQPQTIQAIATISDPASAILGTLMFGSRVLAIWRDRNARHGPPPPPRAPINPTPTGDTAYPSRNGNDNPVIELTEDGHLPIPPAYIGTDSL